jgi:hypothetical protein
MHHPGRSCRGNAKARRLLANQIIIQARRRRLTLVVKRPGLTRLAAAPHAGPLTIVRLASLLAACAALLRDGI